MGPGVPLMMSGGAPWGRELPAWPGRRRSLGLRVLPGWAGHSPGVDGEDLADEEGSTLRDIGVQLEGIEAPCQDAVLCLDGVQFEERRPPTEPARAEGVAQAGVQRWEGTQHPLPTHPWFGTATAARVSRSPCPAGKGLQGYRIPQPTTSLVSPMAPSPGWG